MKTLLRAIEQDRIYQFGPHNFVGPAPTERVIRDGEYLAGRTVKPTQQS